MKFFTTIAITLIFATAAFGQTETLDNASVIAKAPGSLGRREPSGLAIRGSFAVEETSPA